MTAPSQGKFAALDWLRWAFVAVPMLTLWPVRDPWLWPLAAATLIVALPLLWPPGTLPRLLPVSVMLVIAGSSALWTLAPNSWASVTMFSTVFQAVRLLPRRQAVPAVVICAAGCVAWMLSAGVRWTSGVQVLSILVVVVLLAINRKTRLARLEQAELAVARAQTAAEEHARAAALDERARIARELHDVLAHSLAGLALNLQGARLMLIRDGAGAEALAQIERAQKLATDGLAEARNAVAALRDDVVPVERTVADLLAGYRLDTGATAELTVVGQPRDLAPAVGMTLVRAVQEALSNSRKHAAKAGVEVTMTYGENKVEVLVNDHQGRRPPPGATAGYGLRGMKERVELLDGNLESGPVEDGWRVHLKVPA